MSQRAKPEPRVTSEAKVPEPSIDEILASIRRSIVPEDVPAGKPQRRPRRQADVPAAGGAVPAGRDGGNRAGAPAAWDSGDDGILADDGIAADDGAARDDGPIAANGQEPGAFYDIGEPDINRSDIHQRDNGGGDRAGTVAWQADGPLLSARTVSAVDTAFGSLKHTVVTHNPPTLEDLAREMLRPMLKAWLDANLPSMVERLVQAEIERVSRRR